MKQILKLFRRAARKSRISNSIHPPRQSCDRIGRFSIAIAFYRSSARRRISARRIATVVVALSSIALPSLILREGAGFPGCIKLSINPSRGTRDAENTRVADSTCICAISPGERARHANGPVRTHTRMKTIVASYASATYQHNLHARTRTCYNAWAVYSPAQK